MFNSQTKFVWLVRTVANVVVDQRPVPVSYRDFDANPGVSGLQSQMHVSIMKMKKKNLKWATGCFTITKTKQTCD